MRVLTLTGNHPRHHWIVGQLSQAFGLAGAITVRREALDPEPTGPTDSDRANMRRHFRDRADREAHYFAAAPKRPSAEWLEVASIEDQDAVGFVQKVRPDVAVIFGTGLIKPPLFDTLPAQTFNLHLGLSPRYRGAATLFWPFYFLEPAYAGATFHRIVAEPDAGAILHQSVPEMRRGDGIHDIGCKTVLSAGVDAVTLLRMVESGKEPATHRQRGTGKNFLGSDFRPEHLRIIYDVFGNRIVDAFLDGTIEQRRPKLIRQFP